MSKIIDHAAPGGMTSGVPEGDVSTLPGNPKDKRFYSETPRQGKVILVTLLKSVVISGFGKSLPA
jgi:hypothetical protein